MPRRRHDREIIYRVRDPETNRMVVVDRIELIEMPFNVRKFWVRFNGRNSDKCKEATITEISIRLRKLLIMRIWR